MRLAPQRTTECVGGPLRFSPGARGRVRFLAVSSAAIKVSNRVVEIGKPDKVLFPDDGATKEDLARYYAAVAGIMVPLVRARPVMMQRFPDGIGKPPIVQQRAPDYFPDWINRVTVRKRGGTVTHITIDNAATLVYLAGQAVITPHVWASRADRPEQPDQLIFDLDPPGDDIPLASNAARIVREILIGAGLVPFLKTSGGRGLHVHVPIRRGPSFEEAGAFAYRVGEMLASADPKRFTLEFHKVKREGRLFIDIGRNAYAQMAVAPYAVRSRAGAPVATPIDWDELPAPPSLTIKTVPKRIATQGDPWAAMPRSARSLPAAAKRI